MAFITQLQFYIGMFITLLVTNVMNYFINKHLIARIEKMLKRIKKKK